LPRAVSIKQNLKTSFFAAMRDKEQVETERKNLARNVEKQGKAVERLLESERNLAAQVMSLEKDLASVRRQYEARSAEVASLKFDHRELKALHEGDITKYTECRNLLTERDEEVATKKAELQTMSQELSLLKKQVERNTVKLHEKANGSSSMRELELEEELKKTMNVLKCSACKGAEFRDTVLTRCMHTFCRTCVDSRITTRQRKCPACNQPFTTGEVQTIYLQ